jgi:hypothetical protein
MDNAMEGDGENLLSSHESQEPSQETMNHQMPSLKNQRMNLTIPLQKKKWRLVTTPEGQQS